MNRDRDRLRARHAILLVAMAAGLASGANDYAHAQKLEARYVISMTGIRVGHSAWTVNFDNDPSATTFVNSIQVVTQLDPSLDATTFQLGDIKVGDFTIHIAPGTSEYTQDFDFTANRSITKTQIKDLYSLHWLADARPVLLIGQTGVGKTFLAQALGLFVPRADLGPLAL